MSLENLKTRLPDYAKDLKLNLSSLAAEPALNEQQRAGTFVASALGLAQRRGHCRDHRRVRAEAFARGSAGGACGGGHHGDEQHLLPLRASGIVRPITDAAGQAAHERDRQARRRKGRFRIVVALRFPRSTAAACASTRMRKSCAKHGFTAEQIQAAVRIASVVHAVAATLDGVAADAGAPDVAA